MLVCSRSGQVVSSLSETLREERLSCLAAADADDDGDDDAAETAGDGDAVSVHSVVATAGCSFVFLPKRNIGGEFCLVEERGWRRRTERSRQRRREGRGNGEGEIIGREKKERED